MPSTPWRLWANWEPSTPTTKQLHSSKTDSPFILQAWRVGGLFCCCQLIGNVRSISLW